MNESVKCVDIIIPIYNAFEELNICIDSVRKHTDLTKHRLVLIDDKSSDERIYDYVEQQRGTNVIVVHNERNKGFSAGINIGMKMSDANDVILLNSDTVVTKGWVEKLIHCAYLESAIGTVTPLSNNATLCSVPNMFEENRLPEDFSVDEMAELVERISLKKYPRISVANGYCMYVKREVIDSVGYFDEETFKRGYGEENDFCNRARQMGYFHVMCDDTYIYHSGTQSFADTEKLKLIAEHEKILRDRYPQQMRENDIYVRDNPNADVGMNIKLHMAMKNGRKNILYVLQSDFREDSEDCIGGTQLHVKQLKDSLKTKCNIVVAAVNANVLNVTIYIDEDKYIFAYPIYRISSLFSFRDECLAQLWRNVLEGFSIDIVHIHHSIKLSFDLFYIAKEYGVPLVATLHDFFYICPSEKLLDHNNNLCIEKNVSAEDCRNCLKCRAGISDKVNYLEKWRMECFKVLKLCDEIFVPSVSAKVIYSKYYPEIADKITVREHGYTCKKNFAADVVCSKEISYNVEKEIRKDCGVYLVGWVNTKVLCNNNVRLYAEVFADGVSKALIPMAQIFRPDVTENYNAGFKVYLPYNLLQDAKIYFVIKNNDVYQRSECAYVLKEKASVKKKLNIAFIGGINEAKGGNIIADIVQTCKADVNWFVMGGIGSRKLDSIDQKNLIKTGWYDVDELSSILKLYEIDIIGILSIWPETYSYTLTESLVNKVPVIVNGIGALKDRMRKEKYGWVVSPENSVDDFLNVVEAIVSDESQLQAKREALKDYIVIPEEDVAENYYDDYISHIAGAGDNKMNNSLVSDVKDDGVARCKPWISSGENCDYRSLFAGYCCENFMNTVYGDSHTVSHAEYIRIAEENKRIKQSVAYRFSRKLVSVNIPGKYLAYKFIKKRMN